MNWADRPPKWMPKGNQMEFPMGEANIMSVPRKPTPIIPNIQQSMQLNPNIMKRASIDLFVATEINDRRMQKHAGTMWSALKGMAGQGMAHVQPALDKGFGAVGRGAMKLPSTGYGGKATSLLTGGMHDYSDAVNPSDMANLGKLVSKRVGVGAGAAYGGTLAAEAPFKYQNNQRYEDQQNHPIRSWLAQHLAGAPKLQPKGYLNPFSI